MKIIKENKDYKKQTFEIICGKCGSELEYTLSDCSPIFNNTGEQIGGYIQCPRCGKIIQNYETMCE